MNEKFLSELVKVAKSELASGAREIGGNNRGPFVAKYLAPSGLKPPQPWCAAFVSWCAQEAARRLGLKPPKHFVSVMSLLAWLSRKGQLLKSPRSGVIAFWARGRSPGLGHVGIVTEVRKGTLVTIEGNRTPQVKFFLRPSHGPESPLAYGYFIPFSGTLSTGKSV